MTFPKIRVFLYNSKSLEMFKVNEFLTYFVTV